jgi:hypothetical protein
LLLVIKQGANNLNFDPIADRLLLLLAVEEDILLLLLRQLHEHYICLQCLEIVAGLLSTCKFLLANLPFELETTDLKSTGSATVDIISGDVFY